MIINSFIGESPSPANLDGNTINLSYQSTLIANQPISLKLIDIPNPSDNGIISGYPIV